LKQTDEWSKGVSLSPGREVSNDDKFYKETETLKIYRQANKTLLSRTISLLISVNF
jgi:hypothetical protein